MLVSDDATSRWVQPVGPFVDGADGNFCSVKLVGLQLVYDLRSFAVRQEKLLRSDIELGLVFKTDLAFRVAAGFADSWQDHRRDHTDDHCHGQQFQ